MPFDHDVKQLAYTLDPACWVSYSGKGRWFKAALDDRRNAALRQAQAQIDAVKARHAARQEQRDRERRTGAHVLETAKSLGWPDDGEGALEFLLRRTREVAIEDCKGESEPVCVACGQPWTGEACGQKDNGWPFEVCAPVKPER
ncbi:MULTISPECIES: hypothetical protein [unclassified Bradyrhizobium]|uniref:hypothetical protein n=1 Tax=unclassified Bradyrhizobium TaxID=2631580 RepID=UPI0028E4D871|nr:MULTISPECIES: hypothetical protein [unclassified Bradyrhizobium]